ncbi:Sensor histidine kinase TodS [Kordia antarctica]|uniref:histidine kinase n=1 Tax=Kordia antarctica TaxID=1218801 RepID=A0A7L4ZVT0_9FLAO|nr:hybrid sensor histidine kinase/response regulator transcription factor [Kordia antarctica]QHI39244.1 Sensor histidine kinase TodS [Kordia antarctica]
MAHKKFIAFILVICFSSCLFAQELALSYTQKLTITEGLAHNGVTSILEDSKGFFWFGTYEGINKYDGYELKTYKNTIDNNLLTSNRVRSISEDKKGNLWIGTDQGLTIYNYSKEQFDKFSTPKLSELGFNNSILRDIVRSEENEFMLCVTEQNGLFVFNENDYSFLGQYKPTNNEEKKVRFLKALQIDKFNYLISTSIGLFNFNLDAKNFTKVLSDTINHSKSVTKISDISFLVILQDGIAIISKDTTSKPVSFQLKRIDLEQYQFNTSLIDANENLWLGTLNDGIVYINNASSFIIDKDYKSKTFTDDLPILRSSFLASSSNTNCWFGTFNEGLYRFDINKNPFHTATIKSNGKNSLGSTNVTHIAAIDDERAYLTSSLGGLTILNTQNKKFEEIPFQLSQKELASISAVFVDSKKNTWLRFRGENGLRRFVSGSNKLKKVENVILPNAEDLVLRSFSEDTAGNIWIASNTDVYKIIVDTNNTVKGLEKLSDNLFFKDKKPLVTRRVFIDSTHNFVWIGTQSKGLIRIKNSDKTSLLNSEIEQYIHDDANSKSISSNFVTSMLRLPNNDFWIGTEGGGICKVLNSDTSPSFISFTEKNGLSNNVVKSILYDTNYNLWISTNIGLNLFNTQKREFRKFNNSDGLAFEDFWYASTRLKNETLILSGLDGFIHFNSNEVPNVEELPRIQFENFKIFNKKISPGDTINNRVLLNKTITEADKIVLKHTENVFSVDFVSLHYLNPKNHNLKYRLLPFNEQWIEVPSDQKTISYNGLQPGSYQLSVMASNSLNDWTEPKTLTIIIEPSLWNTNVAYILYVLFGILIIYTVVRVIFKIQSLNHKVEIEQFEKDKVEEVNEAKLRFFANISHEIKTPLTLISRPLDVLKKSFRNNPEANDKLDLIKRQSKKIQQLIEQVQDFRRADVNMLKMHYSRFNFGVFMQDLIIDFKFLADNDDKKLELIGDESLTIVSADKDKLEKIFNNLLNNAFKYTSSGDAITISYTKENDKDLIVKVTDTGKGIDSVDLTHIFERFYQSEKKDNTHISGSGIGLAFSKRLVEMHYGFISAESILNEGTTITTQLPIVKKHLPTDVLDEIDLPKEKEVSVTTKIIQENTESDIISSGDFKESVIFYAEDNLEMRNFVSNLLAKYFIVKSFRNGKECFDAMEDEWPDIVISDVQMPEMNGLDLCLRIKSDLKTSHIPVILLTALTNIEDHLQGIRDGADAYIKKPFHVQHLITNVEALLTIRKQLRERYQVGIPLTKENNKNNRNDNAFLEKLYSLIEENLDNQEFDLNNLARELYLNRTHFYQKVKVLTNQTPFELLKMYRLKKAAEFLAQKGLSVNEAFMMTGFKSRTHFTKVFKEKYEVSPGKYAATIRKQQSNS